MTLFSSQGEYLGVCNAQHYSKLDIRPNAPIAILVHGCHGSAGNFVSLSKVLEYHGQNAVCFSYNDREDLNQTAGRLAQQIHFLAEKYNPPKITIIGHSMGGLIARRSLVEGIVSVDHNTPLELVTISSPLSGIQSARMCASPVVRMLTLGLHDLICIGVSGEKWFQIAPSSDFIRSPGGLSRKVERHLMILTDERGACRKADNQGRCLEDDYVFSLEEQRQPHVEQGVLPVEQVLKVGHVEVVGRDNIVPTQLIDTLASFGILDALPEHDLDALSVFLDHLYSH